MVTEDEQNPLVSFYQGVEFFLVDCNEQKHNEGDVETDVCHQEEYPTSTTFLPRMD